MRTRPGILLAMALLLVACVNDPAQRTGVAPVAPDPGAHLTVLMDAPEVAALSTESRESLVRSPLRMLVLPTEYAQGTMLMEGPHWAALAYHAADGLTITLHATDAWHDVISEEELADIGQPNASARGEGAWETVNEGIRSIAWTEHDVAYALEVECANHEQDVRCTESEFIVGIANSLVPAHAGGAR